VESVSKSPKKRFFAWLYWSEEDSLFIRLDFFCIVCDKPLIRLRFSQLFR
jgi:hypothetical protein